ncbi:MAG: NifU family protein [Acidimicrobiales bacterium]
MALSESTELTPVLTISETARNMVIDVLSEEPDPSSMALWLEVSGQANGVYSYDMYFESKSDAGDDDVMQHGDDLTVVIPKASIDKLQGATLDVGDQGGELGLVIINPNTPAPPAPRPAADLSGSVAQAVIAVLESAVNPGIAAHGGRADLVAVEEGTAYLRLSGGCQGCGLAAVTLSQGIESAIKEGVPEIVAVVDVTDHAAGENPYFEPAKK